jgi:hypothetical protein
MRIVIIEQTDLWQVESHGNGFAYAFYRKSDGASAFLQGDDATQWRDEYDSMQAAYSNPDSVWHSQSWNACLFQLCGEYVESGK